jgi:hypothetical protein
MSNQETEQFTQQERQIMENNQPYSIVIENKTDKIIENVKLFDVENVLKNGIFNNDNNLTENGVEITMDSSGMAYRECLYQFLYRPFVCELFFLSSKEIEFYNSVNSVIIQKINDENIYNDFEIECKKIGGFQLKFNTEFNVNKFNKIIIPEIPPYSKIKCVFYPTKFIN